MRRVILKIISIFVMVILVDYLVGTVFKSIYAKLPDKDCSISIIDQLLMHKTTDVLVLGSSSADRHYNTQIMTDSLGIDVFNGGLAGHDMIYCNLILRGFLERGNPKCIILDVRPGLFDGSFISAMRDFRGFYGISKTVTEYFNNETDWQQRLKMKSGLYRYNCSISDLINVYREQKITTDGFRPLKDAMDVLEVNRNSGFTFNQAEYNSLISLVQICKEESLILIFCKSPCTSKNDSFDVWLTSFCKDNNIVLIDEESNEVYYSHPDWFYDGYHLNHVGANVFTTIIAGRIKQYI